MKQLTLLLAIFLVMLGVLEVFTQRELGATGQDVEVGVVNWQRDFDQVLEDSRSSGKPVLALFQEVPGCHGCKKFGKEVLSYPLLVEAIENEFIPVLIYNNRGGKDAELLTRYSEPAWNFQVIRFLNAEGGDIIPRRDRVWSIEGVARRMKQALESVGRTVPEYLKATVLDWDESKLSQAAFQMYCYWTGEYQLGKIDGVQRTEAGYIEGREVTRVWYDSSIISLPELAKQAAKVKCADRVFAPKDELASVQKLGLRLKAAVFDPAKYKTATADNQKKQISGTPFARLNLSPYQSTKVNAFVRVNEQRARSYLSPKQLEKLAPPKGSGPLPGYSQPPI